MEKEIWKDIAGYEGLYKVSNLGRIKKLGNNFSCKEKILVNSDCHGYLHVNLYKNGTRKSYLVHRLVALSFIENTNNYMEINHIDENKHNNCVENLEWCTRKYNNNYGLHKIKMRETVINNRGRKVKINNMIFNCILDAARYYNCSSTCIYNSTKTGKISSKIGYEVEFI